MRTEDLVDSSGHLLGFTVSAFETDPRGIRRLIQSIAGVEIIESSKPPSKLKEKIICEFEIDGQRFVAKDPIGNGGFFWIGPDPVRHLLQTEVLRDVFQAKEASRLFRLLGMIVGALLTIGSLVLISSANASSISYAIGGLILGAYFVYFGVTGRSIPWASQQRS